MTFQPAEEFLDSDDDGLTYGVLSMLDLSNTEVIVFFEVSIMCSLPLLI